MLYNKLTSLNRYNSHTFINVNSLAGSQLSGKITVNVPGLSCGNLIFKVRDVNYISEQEYYWNGVLEPIDTLSCSEGFIYLLSTQYGRQVSIHIEEEQYEINELSSSRYILSHVNDSINNSNECYNGYSTLDSIGTAEFSGCDGNCDVRCLVLYTTSAKNSVVNINNLANMAIQQTNQALANSSIDMCELRIKLSGVEELPSFIESDVIDVDINLLSNNLLARQRRDATESDIVILFTNADYGFDGLVAEVGPNDSLAYGIVNTNNAIGNRYIFAHEVGHLFGARHSNDSAPGYAHGHTWLKGLKRKRTILGFSSSPKKSRIPHYSNPKVYYQGKKTGVDGENDNARQLRKEACTVANFRETILPFYIGLHGEQYACPCESIDMEVMTSGGAPGPFTFNWFSSIDGINWTNLQASGANVIVLIPCIEGLEGFFIRVDVVSSDGQSRSVRRYISVQTQWPGQLTPCQGHKPSSVINLNSNNLEIFPNPTKNNWIIDVNSSTEDNINFKFLNIDGKVIYDWQKKLLINDEYQFEIDGAVLLPGTYFLKITSDTGITKIAKLLKY